ncbi:MAG TPA: FAD-dependent oxidoreductase, partial [Hyphomicrobiaceae bacterium]|nr:FAD-dependent oxidoreductase [Hyphomicrobiaceae bacterium]
IRRLLDMAALEALVASACAGLGEDVKAEPILAETRRNLYDGVPIDEVYKASILAARTLIEKDPDYTYATARLLLHTIFKEVLGRDLPPAEMAGSYADYFPGFVKRGVDAELLDQAQVRAMLPYLDFDNARFPIQGGLMQRRGGTVRHDAVAWGYARAADQRGVDIIQNCEVTGLHIEGGKAVAVETTRGTIRAKRIGIAVAGNSSRLAAMAGMRLPIESHVLQAFVSEGIKPLIDQVVTFGAAHFYISQSDKGGLVFGGDIDGYNSYAQRGSLPVVEDVMSCSLALFPSLSRLRYLRQWGGIMDMSMDGSPIIDRTPIEGLYLNGGWCYGGFKATPASGWCFSHTIATGTPHRLNAAYRLDRFATGHVIDESGHGAVPNLH